MNPLRHLAALRHGWAAIVTWMVVSALVLYAIRDAATPYSDLLGETIALQLLFLFSMFVTCAAEGGRVPAWARVGALWMMLAAALALGALLPISFLPIYTIIWIAFTPQHMSPRWAHVTFAALTIAWYLIERLVWENTTPEFSVALYATFHYFALLSARNTQLAEVAQVRAESLNRELVATQHLLAEASRQGERTRIARDLHDLLGHHLTALTINLQVAERVAEGEARERVAKCHGLARDMLGDVRAAVTTLRDDSAVDFTEALRLIVKNIPQLRIHLEMDDDLRIDDVQIAESLLRCVQEAITNTLRHASASECTVRVWRDAGRLHAQIHDNGRVDAEFEPGNGLTGMRERIERVNGKLVFERVRSALQIRIQIPLAA
ncbi:MAG: sensor histidine kinase [Gammaproteobacteria bacterium]